MRAVRLLPCAFVIFLPSIATLTFAATKEDPTVITKAAQAFSGSKPLSSVELTGRATWFAGSGKDEGSVRLVGKSTGENLAAFNLSNGTRTEKQSAIGVDRSCTWSGKDGEEHETSTPNCWTATIWFLPHLALQNGSISNMSAQGAVMADDKSKVSPHILNLLSFPVDKLASKQAEAVQKQVKLIEAWSLTDLTLDPTSSLPIRLRYTTHPDDNSFVDLAVEVRYSAYKAISGVQIPMHIERYVNGSLQLSIDLDSAAVN